MTPREDKALTALRDAWPSWEFWLVHAYIGPTWWCARLKLDEKTVLNAHSPRELTEMLGAAAGGTS